MFLAHFTESKRSMRFFQTALILLIGLLLNACVFQSEYILEKEILPEVTNISTSHINANGGDVITLTGSNLDNVKTINLKDASCTTLRKISSTQLECTTPTNSGVPAKADLKIITKRNTEVILNNAFTYVLALGQIDETYGYKELTLSTPWSGKVFGNKFIVTDYNSNRVLIWNNKPTSTLSKPDLVLGQPNLRNKRDTFPVVPTASSLRNPAGIWSDGTKLVITDFSNNRILIWNTFPTTNGQAADLVLGQPDFSGNTVNNGPNTVACGNSLGLNACSLNQPQDVFFEENKLVVTDRSNHRLLIWDGWPTQNQQPANHVIGQPSFIVRTTNNGPNTVPCGNVGGRNKCSFSTPAGMSYQDGKVYLADTANNRVLIFNAIPTSHGTPADLVLGQPGFTTSTANNGPNNAPCGNSLGRNQCSLSSPYSITTNSTQLYVTDYGNHRVLGWNALPTSNQQPADIVIGQTSFTVGNSNKGNTQADAGSLVNPRSSFVDDEALWITDSGNNRILKFDPLPAMSASASMIWGHAEANEGIANDYKTNSNKLQLPTNASFDGTHLIIVDRLNNRIIIEPNLPSSLNSTAQRIVLGQPDHLQGSSNNGPNTPACGGVAGLNACSIDDPLSAIKVGPKLIVNDFGNNRVLIWNTFPTQNQQPADVVLGQPDFISNTTNNGPNTAPCGGVAGRNACSFSGPIGLASDGTNLVVTDQVNNRVLIWNAIPTSNQAPANVVLGQPDFISNTANNGPNTADCDNALGVNRCSLSTPYIPRIVGTKLILSDYNNNRVLIWNTIPVANQEPADIVLGHSDFITNTMAIPPTANSMRRPIGICVSDSGKLVIGDSSNHRLLIYNQIPTSSGVAPDEIKGQSSETGYLIDGGGDVSLGTFNTTFGVNCYQENVFVADNFNARILIFPL